MIYIYMHRSIDNIVKSSLNYHFKTFSIPYKQNEIINHLWAGVLDLLVIKMYTHVKLLELRKIFSFPKILRCFRNLRMCDKGYGPCFGNVLLPSWLFALTFNPKSVHAHHDSITPRIRATMTSCKICILDSFT